MWNRRSACLGVAVVFAWIAASWPAIACGQATDAFVETWSLTVTPDDATKGDGGKAFQEAIVFEDAQLMAENYAFYGFKPNTVQRPISRNEPPTIMAVF